MGRKFSGKKFPSFPCDYQGKPNRHMANGENPEIPRHQNGMKKFNPVTGNSGLGKFRPSGRKERIKAGYYTPIKPG